MRRWLLALAALCIVGPAAGQAGHPLTASTHVVALATEPLQREPVHACLAPLDVGRLIPVSVGTNQRVALQGVAVGQPMCAPYPIKPQKVGGYLEPTVYANDLGPVPIVSWTVDMALCPLGFETVASGSLSCSMAFLPVDIDGLGPGPIFLSDLDLPYTGFVKACYDVSGLNPITGESATLEIQDHFMAVTWDDLATNQPLALAAVATGLDPRTWSSPNPCT